MAKAECKEANKPAKRSIRSNKHKYVEEQAMTTKKAASEGLMKKLHGITKKLAQKYRKLEQSVEQEGKPMNTIQEQRKRWAEQFKEFLDKPDPLNPPNIEATKTQTFLWMYL
ncbi:unnamed protein product [Schistosoma margrebowiei]|uniref:Uncharacterized protein n=1 Tax=Schistosoma margrebowiei TaxID=48269 RepID=A0A183MQD4_9TREM|nr:unnamed protein product [Schistosoma margrebowiei]